ncbi:MAG: acetoin utilization protein AcuC [Thermoleophilia bacterium]|nr:acetoin utilization protein AcuC [Thermoleophilia bacterium]
MTRTSALIYSESYLGYKFSPWHPLKPERLLLTAELIKAYGLPGLPGMRIVEPRLASDEELRLVHDQAYIDKVRELSDPEVGRDYAPGWGLGTGDNPVFPRMHEASATIAGGALVAARMIMESELDHALHVGGGLHHAHRDHASGFCIYNDVALAVAWLKRNYSARVLYLDFDAHHGDGVQAMFYGDADVMTVSFHESGMYLFPGSGFTNEAGTAEARGFAVNLPLAPGTTDDIFLEAYDELVPPLARAFKPDIIVTQNGCDAHWSDPLTHLGLTLKGFAALGRRLHELAHEVCGGRWLGSGGGGYQAYTVVPRAWTRLMAEMAGTELPEPLPESWRRLCGRFADNEVPLTLTGDEPPEPEEATLGNARNLARKGTGELKELVFPLTGAF